ncbi:MAG: hypothetical protein QOH73_2202, partial [Gaiellaceae bacterium]|nr:hypothetical protein [Gaiellaceae bacterium]
MNRQLPLLLGLTPTDERAIESVLYDSGLVEVTGSAGSAHELAALAVRSAAEVALVSLDLQQLDARSCARLRAGGLRLVGLALEPATGARLRELGVDAIVDATVSGLAFVAALESASDPDATEQAPTRSEQPDDARDDREGSVVAVIGGGGAAGASECASSLAAL